MAELSDQERAAKDAVGRLNHVNASGQRLADSIQAWLATDPIHGAIHIAEDRLSWELRLSVASPDLDSWGLMFGDAIHNLRSVLDNLLYAVANSVGASDKGLKDVQFPIVTDDVNWSSESKRRLSMLPPRVQRAVESVQPFQRPLPERPFDALAILAAFNNRDKHRIAIVESIEPREISHEFQVEFEDGCSVDGPPRTVFDGQIRDAAVAVRQETAPDRIKQVLGSGHYEAQVVIFDEWGVQYGITSVLVALGVYVSQVLDVVLAAWSAPEAPGAA